MLGGSYTRKFTLPKLCCMAFENKFIRIEISIHEHHTAIFYSFSQKRYRTQFFWLYNEELKSFDKKMSFFKLFKNN